MYLVNATGSYFYGGSLGQMTHVFISNGTDNTFAGFTQLTLINGGKISSSIFNYTGSPSGAIYINYAGSSNNAKITNSEFHNVNNQFYNNTAMIDVSHSDFQINESYRDTLYYGNGDLNIEPVNVSYSKFTYPLSYQGQFLPFASIFYNTYFNFTIPLSDASNSAVYESAIAYQTFVGNSTSLVNSASQTRGSIEVNDNNTNIYWTHNDWGGLAGVEFTGTGHIYVANNNFTEQYFWTAFFDFFTPSNSVKAQNILFANNTFRYYDSATLENNIDTYIIEGGGNTYVTTGEDGTALINSTFEYNSFNGSLFVITENTNQHASYLLGTYTNIEHNYFSFENTPTSQSFNSGPNIAYPYHSYDVYSGESNYNINISYNYFNNISSVMSAIAGIAEPSGYSVTYPVYSTINITGNVFSASSNTPNVILAYTSYTFNIYNQSGFQTISRNGTATLVSGGQPSGFTANVWAVANISQVGPTNYAIIISENGLNTGTSWKIKFDGVNYTITTSSYTFNEPDGSYSLIIYNVTGYNSSVSSTTITVNGANVNYSITYSIILKHGYYEVQIIVNGLPKNTNFTLYINGQFYYSHDNEWLNISLPNGSYLPEIILPNNYVLSNQILTLNVNGNNTVYPIYVNYQFNIWTYTPEFVIAIIFIGLVILGAYLKRAI